MAKVFTVIVTDAKGVKKIKHATVGGLVEMTLEGLGKHFVDLNLFPGAKDVEVHESTATVPDEIKKKFPKLFPPAGTVKKDIPRTPQPRIVRQGQPGDGAAVAEKTGSEVVAASNEPPAALPTAEIAAVPSEEDETETDAPETDTASEPQDKE